MPDRTCPTDTKRIKHVNTNCIATMRIRCAMTPDERLRLARTEAGFSTQADAAKRLGVGQSTYRSHENGTRGFSPRHALIYGRAFKVNPAWLLAIDKTAQKDDIAFCPDADDGADDTTTITLPVVWPNAERLAAAIRPLLNVKMDADTLALTLAERLPTFLATALAEHPAARPSSRRANHRRRPPTPDTP